MNMRIRAISTVVLAACLYGCQSNSGSKPSMESPEQPSTTTPTPDSKPATAPEPEASSPSAPTPVPEKQLEIVKPGTNGWKPAPAEKTELQQFAERADKTVATVAGAEVEAQLMVESAALRGSIGSKLHIKDLTRYAMEYQLPSSPSDNLTLKGNAGKHIRLQGGKWVSDPAQTPAGTTMVTAWPREFTGFIAEAFAKRQPIWQPLLTEISKPNSAYAASLEYQTLPVGTQQVKFARVLITNKKDPERVWEMRFEARQALPVTMKIVDKDAAGKPFKVQWNLQWYFDRKFDEALFELPNGSN